MPILQENTNNVTPTTIQPKPIPTHVVVDADTPIVKSTEYIGNSNWKIQSYYNQILSSSDAASNFDINLPLNEQQYDRIDNLVLSVTEALVVGNLSSLTGQALISDDIRPYEGDMFVADLDSNRPGLFRITDVVVKNTALTKVYAVTYVLDTTYENDPLKFKAINTAVTRVYVYDDTSLLSMSDPVLLEEDYAYKVKIESELSFIMDNYIKDFVNERKSLVSPSGVYDPFATTLFLNLYSGSLSHTIERETAELHNTIYDLLLEQRADMISSIIDLGLIDATADLYLNQGRYGLVRTGASKKVVTGITTPITPNTSTVLPIVANYIFSNEFLTDLGGVSLLEKSLYKYIHKDFVPKNDILELKTEYSKFTKEERYFYTPLIILLYKYSISKIFSRR